MDNQALAQALRGRPQAMPSPAPMVDPQRAQMMAEGLRRQRQLGMGLMASGASAAQAPGRSLAKADPESLLMDASRQNQVGAYQQWQMEQAARNARYREERDAINDAHRTQVLERTLENDRIRAERGGSPRAKITSSDAKGAKSAATALAGIRSAVQYAQRLNSAGIDMGNVNLGPLDIPGSRGVLSWASRQLAPEMMQTLSPDSVAIAELWQQYANVYEMPTRNENFGGQLTAGEKQAWNEATPRPGMTNAQILSNLQTLLQIAETALERSRINATYKYGEEVADGMHYGHDELIQSQILEDFLGSGQAVQSGFSQKPNSHVTIDRSGRTGGPPKPSEGVRVISPEMMQEMWSSG